MSTLSTNRYRWFVFVVLLGLLLWVPGERGYSQQGYTPPYKPGVVAQGAVQSAAQQPGGQQRQQAKQQGTQSGAQQNRTAIPSPAPLPKGQNMAASPSTNNPFGGPNLADTNVQPSLISTSALLAFLAILPFLVMLLTSYIKTVIVMSLLRNALGVQSAPPNQVVNGIALILAIYVMFPTGVRVYEATKHIIPSAPKELVSNDSAAFVLQFIDLGKEPIRDFLTRNSSASHLESFLKLAKDSFPPGYKESLTTGDFIVVVPAFITSQLRDAFEIGVLIYLPFFIIDLVVSNILLAMGMMMLSPMSIALPLKLLLIVMLDGWTVLIQGLVLTFNR